MHSSILFFVVFMGGLRWGWGENSCPPGHPSVTFGDSSPQGEPQTVEKVHCRGEQCSPVRFCVAPNCTGGYRIRPYAVGEHSICSRGI